MTLPDAAPGYRWELQLPESEPRRRHPVRWLVGILILLAFVAGAWFVGEWLARDFTTNAIRSTVITELGLPAGQGIDVTLEGAVLPQLIKGSLDDVTVSSQDVSFGQVTGAVTLHATGIPIRGDGVAESGHATIALDSMQLQALMATVDGFPAQSLGLSTPDVTITSVLKVFAVEFPIGVALQPRAVDGDLVLSPSSFRLGEAELSADDLRARFGAVAKTVLSDWTVCIAQYIPAGMVLSGVSVAGSELIADFDLDGGIVNDPALQAKGTCA